MKKILRGAVGGLVIIFLAFLFYARYPVSRFGEGLSSIGEHINLSFIHLAIELGSGALGIWAFLQYRHATTRARRLVFLSTAVSLLLMWAAEAFAIAIPEVDWVLSPMVTGFNYLWALLVCWSIVIAARHGTSGQRLPNTR